MNFCTICGIALQDGMTCKECQSRIDGFVSLLSPVQHEDGNDYPRSLQRFHLDDDTGPERKPAPKDQDLDYERMRR